MSELTKKINRFFATATKPEINDIINVINLDKHLLEVFLMKYKENLDINTIAYKTGFSVAKINKDLYKIRSKISKLNNYR